MIEDQLETSANKVVAKYGLPTENAVVVKFFCPKHTYYKAKRKPTSKCRKCKLVWKLKLVLIENMIEDLA